MPVFDTVLWDWNGTLLDDAALCCELLNTMLARHGYAPVGSMEAYRQVFCFPIETYYRRAGFDFSRHPFAALADEYMRLYTPRSLGCPLQPDACAVLDALRAQGMRQVMLSASKRENLQQQVEHFGLRSRFDTLLGLSDIYAKSKTEVGLRWLRESGTDPARIMMVGDSEHDFEVARALGVRCVLFSGGHQPREVLAATGAPVIDALAQLLPRWHSLRQNNRKRRCPGRSPSGRRRFLWRAVRRRAILIVYPPPAGRLRRKGWDRMNEALAYVVAQRMERTAAALRKNNMAAYCVKTADEVVPLVKTLLAEGATVGAGGSMTLEECGVMDLLRSGAYHFLDRGAPGLTPEDIGKIYRQIFSADCYFASANAVTEAGEILNVDGNANRVAAITFGPASVILVVGSNKIVKDLAAADARVKAVAAPANAKRLSCKTPCAVTGQCENCQSPGRICCTYVLHRYQRVPGRIKVILVGQELGY